MEHGSNIRKSDYPIDKIFLNRWSPRAMSGEPVTDNEMFTLFEAARWAPSSYNIQPWRFIYAKRDTNEWTTFFNLLGEFNQLWCKNAAALICLIAKKIDGEGKPNRNAVSDAGAAWENLALQASISGLVAHGMNGFDYDRAKTELEIPDDYQVVHMIAIGKPGSISSIPERMQKAEHPSDRKPLKELIFEGKLKK